MCLYLSLNERAVLSRQEKRKAVENVWANLVPRKQIIS